MQKESPKLINRMNFPDKLGEETIRKINREVFRLQLELVQDRVSVLDYVKKVIFEGAQAK